MPMIDYLSEKMGFKIYLSESCVFKEISVVENPIQQ